MSELHGRYRVWFYWQGEHEKAKPAYFEEFREAAAFYLGASWIVWWAGYHLDCHPLLQVYTEGSWVDLELPDATRGILAAWNQGDFATLKPQELESYHTRVVKNPTGKRQNPWEFHPLERRFQ